MNQDKQHFFVEKDSIIRQIWGNGDVILFIFAGAAAEFALHKAVDWLYFTGRLPADPLARLFSTVSYSREIIFSNYDQAILAIDKISAIHKGVEEKRGRNIPEWAYRDVLFMLIDYSIRSYELIERPLTASEKDEVVDVFYRMGSRMGIKSLPNTFSDWKNIRESALSESLEKGDFTIDLYKQYKKHLGLARYEVMKQSQVLLLPEIARNKLELKNSVLAKPLLQLYKSSAIIGLKTVFKNAFLPAAYKKEIIALDRG